MTTLFPVLVWIAAFVAAGIAIVLGPRPMLSDRAIEQLLRYVFIFPLGVLSLWAVIGDGLFPQDAANDIGWATSPYQYEVALANLGLGIASLYAAFAGRQAKLAVALIAAFFMIGSGLGHVSDLMGGDPVAPGNSGPVLAAEFLTPLLALALLWLLPRREGREASKGLAVLGKMLPRLGRRPIDAGVPQPAAGQPKGPQRRPPQPHFPPPQQPRLPQPATVRPGSVEILPPAAQRPPQIAAQEPSLEDELERARAAMREAMAKERGAKRR